MRRVSYITSRHVAGMEWRELFRDNQIDQVEGDILIILLSKPTIRGTTPRRLVGAVGNKSGKDNSLSLRLAVDPPLQLQHNKYSLLTYRPSLGRLSSAACERLPAPVRPQGLPRAGHAQIRLTG